ncbi:hypothetical protein HanPSC8_Chr10g0424231 [Helianthus annuus]|nr:hypothetical protein HanPSC8_Chr10g0424231 [Helianthus annuus]
MDYPPRPPFTVHQGSNVPQDQGSLRTFQPGSSDMSIKGTSSQCRPLLPLVPPLFQNPSNMDSLT